MNIQKLSPDAKITGLNGLTVGDFWTWAYSDILVNTTRSVFGEFIVGAALGVLDKPRIEWDAVDIYYRDKKVEVKTSAYLQSWPQKGLSAIKFDVAQKRSWVAATNGYATEAGRAADCYVFCLYAETDSSNVNLLDMTVWQFYVASTEQIGQALGSGKSVSLKRLQGMCTYVDYSVLKDRIDQVLGLVS